MDMKRQNQLARRLRDLCKPGDPVILTNVYDCPTASIVSAHPSTRAVATASFAFAALDGTEDNDLTLEDNLAGVRRVYKVVGRTDLPLSVDLQDGYDDPAATVKAGIAAGAVGGNIEDIDKHGNIYPVEENVSRLKTVLAAAAEAGVPDFCLNARTDVLGARGFIQDAIERGKAYLAAGATTVYVWGGSKGRGVSDDEIKELVRALGGMINVKMNLRPGFLTASQLADMGVARISVGPEMFHRALDGFRGALEKVTRGEDF